MYKITFLLLASVVICSCLLKEDSIELDKKKELALIEKSINNTIAWAATKDTSLLYSIIANDEDYLEVHPSNRIVVGIDKFKQAEQFWLDDRFKHVNFETWDMHINISQGGTVAWYYCMLNDINEWEGQSVSWENTRWTGVLEKRNGKWRMVQMHFSYAVE